MFPNTNNLNKFVYYKSPWFNHHGWPVVNLKTFLSIYLHNADSLSFHPSLLLSHNYSNTPPTRTPSPLSSSSRWPFSLFSSLSLPSLFIIISLSLPSPLFLSLSNLCPSPPLKKTKEEIKQVHEKTPTTCNSYCFLTNRLWYPHWG